jgi:hypothetical protein
VSDFGSIAIDFNLRDPKVVVSSDTFIPLLGGESFGSYNQRKANNSHCRSQSK